MKQNRYLQKHYIKVSRALFSTFLVLSFALAGSSMASKFPHLKDPKNLLEKMDRFMGRPSFEKAYTCGTKIKYKMNHCARYCEPFVCTEVCDKKITEYLIEIRDCSSESVTVHTLSTGKDWFKPTVEGYPKYNFLRYFFAAPWVGAIDKPGEEIGKNYVVLERIVDENFLLKNGQLIPSKRLYFTYYHYERALKTHVPSKQSIVMGKQELTQGLHLEHNFEAMSKPIGRVVEISKP